MPLAGFRCPPGSPTHGQTNPISHCLGSCPHQCAAPSLLAAIYKLDTGNYHTGVYISASMLCGSGCARQTVLERTENFYEVPVKRFWPFRGTLMHAIIEQSVDMIDEYGWLSEMRMSVPLVYDEPMPVLLNDEFTGIYDSTQPLTITIGGTCDSYNPVTRQLWDMKSMADSKAEMMVLGNKPGTYSPHLEDSWVKQLNIYRWLISKTKLTPSLKKRFKLKGTFLPTPDFLGIQGVSMMNIPRTGASYPLKQGRKGTNIFEIADVPVWPLEQTETFVREEAHRWYKWLVLKEPTVVVPEEKKWLCASCAFNGERVDGGVCFPDRERSGTVTLTIED